MAARRTRQFTERQPHQTEHTNEPLLSAVHTNVDKARCVRKPTVRPNAVTDARETPSQQT